MTWIWRRVREGRVLAAAGVALGAIAISIASQRALGDVAAARAPRAVEYSRAARTYFERGDIDRAFAELMRNFVEQGREQTPGAVINAVSWANSAHSAGQLLQAVELNENAVALARAVYPDQGVQPATLTSFARSLAAVGRLDEALAIVDEAVTQAVKHEERWPKPNRVT